MDKFTENIHCEYFKSYYHDIENFYSQIEFIFSYSVFRAKYTLERDYIKHKLYIFINMHLFIRKRLKRAIKCKMHS